jgi:aminopeptidase N
VSGGQELAGLAHMSEAYGRTVLADPAATSLIAHELAHQWWGNLVTNRDWTHFWLNEGFATFMAAAYKERVRGHGAYLADVEAWQKRVEQLRAAGADKPLVFPDWNRPSPDDRAVVYQKGALVLHELRELLGDAPFWTAVRSYTQRQAGQAVTSTDLQHAFEASSGRELSSFFNERVYLQ